MGTGQDGRRAKVLENKQEQVHIHTPNNTAVLTMSLTWQKK